jgi:hypothetical protein
VNGELIMPWKNGNYIWTVSEKLADLLSGFYGDEYDEKLADLEELVAASRRDQVARLRPMLDELGTGPTASGFRSFAGKLLSELDPDTPDSK